LSRQIIGLEENAAQTWSKHIDEPNFEKNSFKGETILL